MKYKLLVAFALIAGASTSQAAVFVVTKYTDDGSAGTLRWAINQSNAINLANPSSSGNTIQILPIGLPPYVIRIQSRPQAGTPSEGGFLPPLVGPVIVQGMQKGLPNPDVLAVPPSIAIDGSNLVPAFSPTSCPGLAANYDFVNGIWVYSQVSGTGPNVRGWYGGGLTVIDSHNVEISNLVIRNFCLGVATVRSHDNHLNKLTILNHQGTAGVIFTGDNGSSGSTTLSFNNVLENCELTDNADGFEFTRGTHDSTIKNCLIRMTRAVPVTGTGIEYATSGDHNSVINNTIKDWVGSAGVTVGTGNNHVFIGNTYSNNSGGGQTGNGSNFIITNNKFIGNGAAGLSVGGTGDQILNNVITGNRTNGITVAANAQSTLMSQNLISGDGVLGISLGTNANNGQHAPTLLGSSNWTAASLVLAGSLASGASQSFTIEFFANHSLNVSGNGEGEVYLGNLVVTTDGSGNATFSAPLSANPLVDGSTTAYFTGTATDANGNTSQFSPALFLSKH